MKLVLTFTFLLLTISAFGQAGGNLIQTNEIFTKDGIIESIPEAPQRRGKKKTPPKFENGKLNGVEYRFNYLHGQVEFVGRNGGNLKRESYDDNWIGECSTEASINWKSCYVMKGTLMIIATGDHKYLVRFFDTDIYQAADSSIRIDTNPAFISKNKGIFVEPNEPETIVDQLIKGKKLAIHYRKYSNDRDVDIEFDLYGFNEALQYLNWAVSKIQ